MTAIHEHGERAFVGDVGGLVAVDLDCARVVFYLHDRAAADEAEAVEFEIGTGEEILDGFDLSLDAFDLGVREAVLALELDVLDALLDLVEQLIGPDIILWGCHVFCKPASEGFETPWHQDGHYWPIRPLATCTVWVALEPSTRENGCLRVIPGSHRTHELHAHLHEDRQDLVLNQRMADGTFDETQAVDLELQPGEMSMHDVYMIHGAKANTSTQRRTGVALRFMPGSSLFDRDLRPVDGKTGVPVSFGTRPLWLLRGEDRTGRNDFQVGHR